MNVKFYLLHILTAFKTLVTKNIKESIVVKSSILTTYKNAKMINSNKNNFIFFNMKAL